MLKLYAYIPETRVLGFGQRFALWVQGCPFSCSECMTPDSQDFNAGELFNTQALVDLIMQSKNIEGLTLTGGEPFSQAKGLVELLDAIKPLRDLGVITYSGFSLQALQKKAQTDRAMAQLLAYTDLLIDGVYVASLNEGSSLKGSSNQQVHALSARYKNTLKDYQTAIRPVEVHLLEQSLMLVGIPGAETLAKYQHIIKGDIA